MNNCKRCDSEMRRSPIYHMSGDDFVAEPGYECIRCGMAYLTNSDEWIDMRAEPPDDDPGDGDVDDEPPPDPFGGHVGLYAETDGEPFHVLGDPNMSEATLNALRELARAAKRAIDAGEL